MKYCEKCGVTVRGNSNFCPLCQNKLKGTGGKELYPTVKTLYRQHQTFFKLLLLATVAAGAASVAVNAILPQTGYWSLFVVCGILCFWVSLVFAFKKRHNIPKNIILQVLIISGLCVLWDYGTGWHGWSLDYVLPIVTIVAVISLAALARILNMPVSDYIVCLSAGVIFGLVQVIFYWNGMVNVVIPSIVCIALCAVAMTALVLFEGKEIWTELCKRFHL